MKFTLLAFVIFTVIHSSVIAEPHDADSVAQGSQANSALGAGSCPEELAKEKLKSKELAEKMIEGEKNRKYVCLIKCGLEEGPLVKVKWQVIASTGKDMQAAHAGVIKACNQIAKSDGAKVKARIQVAGDPYTHLNPKPEEICGEMQK